MAPPMDWPEMCPAKPVPHLYFKDEPICYFCKAKNPQYPISINSTPGGKTRDEAIPLSDSPSPALSTGRKEGYKSLGAGVAESYRQMSIQNVKQKEKEGYQNAGSAALTSRNAGVTSDQYTIQLTVIRGPYTIRNGEEVWDKSATLVFAAIPLRDQKLGDASLLSLLLEEMDDDDRTKVEGKDLVLAKKYEPLKGPLKISNKQLQKFKTVGTCLSALFPSKSKVHEIMIVVREFQENEDDLIADNSEDLSTKTGKKDKAIKKESDFSSKQGKIKKEKGVKKEKDIIKKEKDTRKETEWEIKKEKDMEKEIKKDDWEESSSAEDELQVVPSLVWRQAHQSKSARPSTPPTSVSAMQAQKRPLSLSSPQQPPRPEAPVPPETPPRPMKPISDSISEGEEEEGQAPPAFNTRAAKKGNKRC
jgi:hypothetical protein